MRLLLIALLLSFSSLCLVGQEEKIHAFHSSIEIEESGSVTVQEKIRIYANGNLFKRGITRALPLTRRDAENHPVRVNYNIREVLVDGNPVNFFTDKEGGDLVIYAGERDKYLLPGY
ncbi:hypothetical protein JS578_12070 [Dysgonomonadaceae bacterium zrk40]|nr:hypothetical protein JS578_12070 [Dysgonomonadaceae bacterium zrk40]